MDHGQIEVTHRAAEWAHEADVSDHVREVCRRILANGVTDRSEATIARLIDAGEAAFPAQDNGEDDDG